MSRMQRSLKWNKVVNNEISELRRETLNKEQTKRNQSQKRERKIYLTRRCYPSEISHHEIVTTIARTHSPCWHAIKMSAAFWCVENTRWWWFAWFVHKQAHLHFQWCLIIVIETKWTVICVRLDERNRSHTKTRVVVCRCLLFSCCHHPRFNLYTLWCLAACCCCCREVFHLRARY